MPGVGIGPELVAITMDVLDCAGARFHYDIVHPEKDENEFECMIHSVKRNGIGIKASIESKNYKQLFMEPTNNMRLRKIMDLYVDVIECKTFPGLENKKKIHKNMDIVIMRQNTEGECDLLEHMPIPNVVENINVMTSFNARRVSEYAFQYAVKHCRKKVSLLFKEDITRSLPEHLGKKTFQEVAAKYPDITTEVCSISHAIKKLMKNDKAMDVVVTNSLLGTILVSILCGIIGSPALLAESNIGNKAQIFESAIRIRGNKLAGQGVANPTAYIMSGVLALEATGQNTAACNIRSALDRIFSEGEVLTKDLGGNATTQEFAEHLVKLIRERNKMVHCKYDKRPPLPPTPHHVEPYNPVEDVYFLPNELRKRIENEIKRSKENE
ncbi:hypothetical protein O3M35_009461 [Rhynocoris fuscipes]